jgi:hypothetical protein
MTTGDLINVLQRDMNEAAAAAERCIEHAQKQHEYSYTSRAALLQQAADHYKAAAVYAKARVYAVSTSGE